MDLTVESLPKAVAIFRSLPNIEDLEFCRALVAAGFDLKVAALLVELLPSAYCRILLRESGCQFADEYERRAAGSIAEKHLLSSNPLGIY